ncbi:MAG: type II toxin-antitoxin system Phd/YefM family antitoxin [Firmicutes bacterium]|nr:type II toxin-antitoxin system Phd/YefM family antitoxin [Bacillota bacterium]
MQPHRYIVDRKGKKRAVVIPYQKYKNILEDLHDLAVAAERRDEPTISFKKLKEKLRTDGVL